MSETFKKNRRLLYRVLWKLGGKVLINELNNKDCEWWYHMSDDLLHKDTILTYAFSWENSNQGHLYWRLIRDSIYLI